VKRKAAGTIPFVKPNPSLVLEIFSPLISNSKKFSDKMLKIGKKISCFKISIPIKETNTTFEIV